MGYILNLFEKYVILTDILKGIKWQLCVLMHCEESTAWKSEDFGYVISYHILDLS